MYLILAAESHLSMTGFQRVNELFTEVWPDFLRAVIVGSSCAPGETAREEEHATMTLV
jgi:hypothetical protein